MLRTSATAARLSSAGVLPVLHDDVSLSEAVDASSLGGGDGDASFLSSGAVATEDDEAARLDASYLWLLVLSAAAECVTTCLWPQSVGATALNVVGPFLDGLSYGVEALPKRGAPSIACLQFRSAFLGCVHGLYYRNSAGTTAGGANADVCAACSRRSRSWWTTQAI